MLSIKNFAMVFVLLCSCAVVMAQSELAFPSAQGFGRFAAGGRGGQVYIVTNLDDAGPGSLRDALSAPGRTIVFEVGGVIKIDSRLVVPDHTTIAGQTAPGGGITIYGDGVAYNTNNVITRFVRIRMGRYGTYGKDAVGIAHGHNMIWDHCSISWGRDGNFDVNPSSGKTIKNLTVQNSIIAQGLQTHSTGGLLIADGASIIRSLYINNHTRNPKARKTTQFINNVVYNWTVAGYILGDTEGRSDGYLEGNYFIPGPNSGGGTLKSPTPAYHVTAKGNYYDSNKDGVLDGRLLGQGDFGTATWMETPAVEFPYVPALSAQDAYSWIVQNAGATLWRDEVDDFLIAELESVGKKGTQISNENELGLTNNVGIVPSGTAPLDADRDGMPDEWELLHGLNPNDASDRNGTQLSGSHYTNLEMYLNELAGDEVEYAQVPVEPEHPTGLLQSTNESTVNRDSKLYWINGKVAPSDAKNALRNSTKLYLK
jgi:pectate lyase